LTKRYEILREAGSTVLLLGNEAIARGAIEYGIGVATAYPGTPSSEIVGTLSKVAKNLGIYVEWSINEKTAFEIAYAAAMSGVPSLTAMKHVGLNVASDPFMSSAYTGVRAGFIIVSADDPYMHSSQNEQDNRWYGLHGYIPVLEPCDPQEAKDLTVRGLEISEFFQHPVILRSVTRLSHVRGPVKLGEIRKPRIEGFFPREPSRWAVVPENARRMKQLILDKWRKIEDFFADFPHNRVEGDGSILVVASGVGYCYTLEAIELLNVKVKLLKISTPVPLPRKLILKAMDGVDKVIVVEECDPVVELQLKSILLDLGFNIKVYGENLLGRAGELTVDKVAKAISKVVGLNWLPPTPYKIPIELPPRPPVLCPGCPHRATFYALKIAVKKLKIDPIYSGDIGCYSLGIQSPFNMQDVIIEMGGSIGLANGFSHTVRGRPVVAIIGDSTFFHAGIPPLVNAVYNKTPMLVLVLDNETTAMTGFQPHPGTGVKADGSPGNKVYIENIAKAIGVDLVEIFDPYDVKRAVEILEKGLKKVVEGGIVLLVARRECSLNARRRDVLKSVYEVDRSKCLKCMLCVNEFACPAIRIRDNGYPYVVDSLCNGCGVCSKICPVKAFTRKD